jgi:hypothetical protein
VMGCKSLIQGWVGARHLLAVIMLGTLCACATSTSPLSPPRLALASAYYNDGQWRVALEEVHKVLQDHPKHPTALGLEARLPARSRCSPAGSSAGLRPPATLAAQAQSRERHLGSSVPSLGSELPCARPGPGSTEQARPGRAANSKAHA